MFVLYYTGFIRTCDYDISSLSKTVEGAAPFNLGNVSSHLYLFSKDSRGSLRPQSDREAVNLKGREGSVNKLVLGEDLDGVGASPARDLRFIL